MHNSLTVALPVFNQEASLAETVARILEVASELAGHFRVIIVDNESTDDTFEIASEIAARYPQVAVVRIAHSHGLGAATLAAKRRALPGLLCLHDGVSEINVEQLQSLWRSHVAGATSETRVENENHDTGSRRFSFVARSHGDMERAHRRVTGFHVVPGHDGDSLAVIRSGAEDVSANGAVRQGGGSAPPITTLPSSGLLSDAVAR